jgi:hypothetical protein
VARPGDPDPGAAGRRRGEAGPGRHPAGRGGLGGPGLLGGPPREAARDARGRPGQRPGPADRRRPESAAGHRPGRADRAPTMPTPLEGRTRPRRPPGAGWRWQRPARRSSLWSAVDPANIAQSWLSRWPGLVVWPGAQRVAAGQADRYLDEVLDLQDIDPAADAKVVPAALSGVASDGRGLDGLLYQPVVTALTGVQRGDGVARASCGGQAAPRHDRAHAGRRRRPRRRPGGDDRPARHATGYVRLLVGSPARGARSSPDASTAGTPTSGATRTATAPRCPAARTPPTMCGPTRSATSDSLSPAEQDRISSRRPAPRRSGTAPTSPRS